MSYQSNQQASGSIDTGSAQLIVTVAICFCAGGLYGWSALITVIERVFAASTEQAGLVFSVAIVAFSLAVFLVPRFPSAFTRQSGCVLFGISGALSLSIASQSATYEWFLLAFSIGFGFSSGAIYINALTIASASIRPTVATPVMVAAFSLGGAVFGPLWRVMASLGWGLNALLVLASAMALSALFVHAFLRAEPIVINERVLLVQTRYTPNDRFVLILLWITFALGSAGGLMVLGLASKIVDIAGGTVGVTSAALAGIAIGNTAGRLSVSYLAQVMSPAIVALLSSGIVCSGLTITGFSDTSFLIASGLIVTALGYGLLASAMPTLVGNLYGKDVFAKVFSVIFTAWGAAGLVSPWLAGVIFDNTGSFSGAILAAFIATIGASVTLLVLLFYLKRGAAAAS